MKQHCGVSFTSYAVLCRFLAGSINYTYYDKGALDKITLSVLKLVLGRCPCANPVLNKAKFEALRIILPSLLPCVRCISPDDRKTVRIRCFNSCGDQPLRYLFHRGDSVRLLVLPRDLVPKPRSPFFGWQCVMCSLFPIRSKIYDDKG